MLNKHAYLIVAHNNFELLNILLSLLDDERNDIYLHIDKKALNVDFGKLRSSVKNSKLFFIRRMNVVWGDYSIIECEIALLKAAMGQGSYGYFHLLSGMDLPIKSQDYIHQFFLKNQGKEFVEISEIEKPELELRCKYYRPLQIFLGRHQHNIPLRLAEYILLKIQRLLKVNRLKKGIVLKKGSNWCSITSGLAGYIVENHDLIRQMFQYTFCSDEVFFQTMLYHSAFWNNRYDNSLGFQNMRLIDWNRGDPYVYRSADFLELKKSPCLFARKFDFNIDRDIVDKVAYMVTEKQEG